MNEQEQELYEAMLYEREQQIAAETVDDLTYYFGN